MAYDDRALRGVGGWLAFFIVTLAIISPLRGLVDLWSLFTVGIPPALADRWPLFRAVGVAEVLVSIGIGWFLAYRLVAVQNRSTLSIVIAGLWISSLAVNPLFFAATAFLLKLPVDRMIAAGGLGLLQGVGYSLIWTLYLQHSRRVANTYAEDDVGVVFE